MGYLFIKGYIYFINIFVFGGAIELLGILFWGFLGFFVLGFLGYGIGFFVLGILFWGFLGLWDWGFLDFVEESYI